MMATERSTGPVVREDPPWEELERVCPGRVSRGVPMSRLTTFRVGGPADALVTPASPEEVAAILRWTRRWQVPVVVMGAGSNILVRDGGIRGLVLRVGPPMDRWEARDQGETIRLVAQAGLPLRRLIREGVRRGWGGISFLVGIPGTLGGAVAMNAGTREGCVADLVEEVTCVSPDGEKVAWGHRELAFSYRRLDLPAGAVIVEAALRLPKGGQPDIRAGLRQRMLQRRQSQPLGLPSAGSVFRNPPGDFAGRIIDGLGLKGLRCGGARVSPRHANFIVNEGGANARDVLRLIREVRQRVAYETGIQLELEIRVVGEAT